MPTSPAGRDRRVAARAPQRGEEQAVADLRPGELGGGAPEDRARERSVHGGAWWQDCATTWAAMPAAASRRTLSTGRSACGRSRRATSPRSSPPASDPEIPRWTRVPSPYTREDAERLPRDRRGGGGRRRGPRARDQRRRATPDRHDRADGASTASAATARSATGSPPPRAAAAWPSARSCCCATGRAPSWGCRRSRSSPTATTVPSQRVAERAGFADTGEIRSVAAHASADAGDGYRGLRLARAGLTVRRGSGRASTDRRCCVLLAARAGSRSSSCASAREELLAAPGAVAVEPARVSYRALGGAAAGARVPGRAPPGEADAAARRAGRDRRCSTPQQVPLAVALAQRHPGAELWQLGADPADGPRLSVRARPRRGDATCGPVWKRVEALGIESGRLGSERGSEGRRWRGRRASAAPTASSVQVTGSSRNAAYSHVCTTTATKPGRHDRAVRVVARPASRRASAAASSAR